MISRSEPLLDKENAIKIERRSGDENFETREERIKKYLQSDMKITSQIRTILFVLIMYFLSVNKFAMNFYMSSAVWQLYFLAGSSGYLSLYFYLLFIKILFYLFYFIIS